MLLCARQTSSPHGGVGVSFGFGCRTDGRTDSSTHQAAVDDLPGRLLHLPQLGHKVPEAGLGHHVVGGEDPHAVEGRGRVLGGGQQTPNHFVFAKLWNAVIERNGQKDGRTGGSGRNRRWRQGLLCGSLDSLPEALRRHPKATSCRVAVSTPD